jgi:hypothetical protein
LPHPRLSKPQQADLIAKALQGSEARSEANRKAQAKREANEYVRLERTVLSDIVPELRRIVSAMIAARVSGEKVVLLVPDLALWRDGQNAPDNDVPDLSDGSSDALQITAQNGSGNQRAKKRAQTERRRARAAAQGYIRATFQVPRVLRKEISAMVNRIAAALEYGAEVRLEFETAEPEAPAFVAPIRHSTPSVPVKADRLDSKTQPPDAYDDPFRDVFNKSESGTNSLFWDIKAAGRI